MINICLWLVCGLLVGGVASRLPHALTPISIIANSVAGTLGALLGGVIFLIFDTTPLGALNMWGLVIALCSAIVAISLTRLIFQYLT